MIPAHYPFKEQSQRAAVKELGVCLYQKSFEKFLGELG